VKESKVAVKRPDKLRVDRAGPKGHAVFRDDGKLFTLYHAEKNVFTDAPAAADDRRSGRQRAAALRHRGTRRRPHRGRHVQRR